MKTTTQAPSEERLLHDVSELKKLGANAVIENGGIIIKGDLKVLEKQIINASIYEYITIVKGDLSFPKMKIPPDNFMPNLKYVLRTVYLRLERTGNNFMSNLLFIGNKLYLHYIENMTDDFMCNLIGVFGDVYPSSRMKDDNRQHVLILENKLKIRHRGYYPEYGIAYFNCICSLVEGVRQFGRYKIYSCIFGEFIAEKIVREPDRYGLTNNMHSKIMVCNEKYMARGKSVRQAVQILEHGIYRVMVWNTPLRMDSDIDAMKFIALFGASLDDVQDFLTAKKIDFSVVKDKKGNIKELITKSTKVSELLRIIGDGYLYDRIIKKIKADKWK